MAVSRNKLVPVAGVTGLLVIVGILYSNFSSTPAQTAMTQIPLPTAGGADQDTPQETLLNHMVTGDKLFPMFMGIYLTGETKSELESVISEVNALLVPTGMRFIEPRQDLVPLDAFMRALPFNFDPVFDAKNLRRSRLTFASHIAALMPLYGRSRGTSHPGMWFWNRGGEPLWIDPLNKYDRKKNAHMLILGPTGAGKSATLNYQSMLTMAIHRPRLVIADAGKSFELLVQDMAAKGLSVQPNANWRFEPVHRNRLGLSACSRLENGYCCIKKARSSSASGLNGCPGDGF